ncbi:MAG: hypothetical protein ACE5NL_01755 [Candidatus Hydrothermarchaeaceae archaeon]
MCKNYKEKLCIANKNKKCLLGEEGAEAEQGACELHGEYDVWLLKDKIVVSNTGTGPGNKKEALGYGLNFLTADELAYKKSLRLEVPVDYELKK